MKSINEAIEESKHLLSENETYMLTSQYLHCDNYKFIIAVQNETGGYIEDCTSDGYGYYLVFSQIL